MPTSDPAIDCPRCRRYRAAYWDARCKVYTCPWNDCQWWGNPELIAAIWDEERGF